MSVQSGNCSRSFQLSNTKSSRKRQIKGSSLICLTGPCCLLDNKITDRKPVLPSRTLVINNATTQQSLCVCKRESVEFCFSDPENIFKWHKMVDFGRYQAKNFPQIQTYSLSVETPANAHKQIAFSSSIALPKVCSYHEAQCAHHHLAGHYCQMKLVRVCHRLFVIVRLFQSEHEQCDLDACGPLPTRGACVPLRICSNLMIERWNETVKAGGISCKTLGLKAWQIWLFRV
ncbi:uncharacterized protein V6R79_014406 [Siganus canaliculatus]